LKLSYLDHRLFLHGGFKKKNTFIFSHVVKFGEILLYIWSWVHLSYQLEKKKQKPAHNFKGEVENEIEKENRV
jgi:hypothetical protein